MRHKYFCVDSLNTVLSTGTHHTLYVHTRTNLGRPAQFKKQERGQPWRFSSVAVNPPYPPYKQKQLPQSNTLFE